VSTQRVDQLRPLADQNFAGPVQHENSLLLCRLHWHEPHARTRDRLADRGSIGGIVLRSLDVCLHVARRHQPHGVAQLRQFSGPVVRGRASLHANQASRQLLEKLDYLAAPKLPCDSDLACLVYSMNLEHVLGEINTDRGSFHVDGPRLRFVFDDHSMAPRRRVMPGAGVVHCIKMIAHGMALRHDPSPAGMWGTETAYTRSV
jgi:hypothetical protein